MDVQAVLNAVAKTAARLCDANDALIWQVEGDQLRLVAKRPGLSVRPSLLTATSIGKRSTFVTSRENTKPSSPVPQNLPRRRVTQSHGRKRVVRGLPIRPWPES